MYVDPRWSYLTDLRIALAPFLIALDAFVAKEAYGNFVDILLSSR